MRPRVAKTTINDTGEFGIRKRLNCPRCGRSASPPTGACSASNDCSHNPIRAAEAFTAVHDPITTSDGHRIAGLRLGDRRAHALLQALLVFYHGCSRAGCATETSRGLLAGLRGKTPDEISAPDRSGVRPAWVRAHGLISRIPGSHRYRITDIGLHDAMLLTHVHTRLLQPGLAQITPIHPPPASCAPAARAYQHALKNQLTQEAGFAA